MATFAYFQLQPTGNARRYIRRDAGQARVLLYTGTRALPKNRSAPPTCNHVKRGKRGKPQLYVKEQSPKVFGAGEHVGPPREDFSRGGKKSLVRHYLDFWLTVSREAF
jgi:hypothetical protein